MDTPPENFENLRRLLALKRHEQPPPGYFDELRAGVTDRLRAGDVAPERLGERLSWEIPWLSRLLESLSARPAVPGLLGAAACAVVLAGVLYAEHPDVPTLVDNDWGRAIAANPAAASAVTAVPAGLAFNAGITTPESNPALNSSTNGFGIPSGLFGAPNLQTLPVARPFGNP